MRNLDAARKLAFARAFDRVDSATVLSRHRDDGAPDDDYQRQRYLALRDSPEKLLQFVREATGSDDAIANRKAARNYLTAMEGKYGT